MADSNGHGMLSRLNLFKGLPNPREVWAWGMYDLANQSFQLLINTLLFGNYVRVVVAPDKETGERWWYGLNATALLLIVALSPVAGAVADAKAWKREILLATGFLCAGMTAALGLVGPGDLWLAAALFIPASVLVGIGENFLGSFLPEIATEDRMGRVSALGFVMSYVGALILLACVIVAALVLGMKAESQWRPLFVFAGLWFLLGMLPAVFKLHEKARPARALGKGTLVGVGFRRLADTLNHLRRFRELMKFLVVFFVFSMGMQVFIYLSGVIMAQLGFEAAERFGVAAEVTVLAGIGALLTAKYQDVIGHRRTIMTFVAIWFVSFLGLAGMAFLGPTRAVFYVLAAGTGLGLGGLGTSSRALVGLFTPKHKTGEFFGLWGMTFKLAGAAAMGGFLAVETVVEGSPGLFLLITAGFFGVGLVGMLWVDERRGIESAREAEREEETRGGAGAVAILQS